MFGSKCPTADWWNIFILERTLQLRTRWNQLHLPSDRWYNGQFQGDTLPETWGMNQFVLAILGPFFSGAVMHHVSPQDCSIQCMVLPRPDPKFVWWIPFFPCWIHILSRFLLVKSRWNPHSLDERDHFCCWFREIGHIQTSKSTTSQRRSTSTTPEGYGRLWI